MPGSVVPKSLVLRKYWRILTDVERPSWRNTAFPEKCRLQAKDAVIVAKERERT
jgi:hypothetical protein